jgi:D-alanyl-D-alanine dipeptidase
VTNVIDRPIPQEPYDDTAEQPALHECGEPLLPLSNLSNKLTVYPIYYHQGYEGTQTEAYLRVSAAKRLVQAAEQLPDGYRLVVLDGWRSYQVQKSLYERFRQNLLAQGWEEGQALSAELSKYVAFPREDVQKPTPHLSGGAVDVTIEGPNGWLEMGTEFDDFSELAATRFYEEMTSDSERERLIRDNRRLLYHLMTDAGFVNYPKEWWHYEFGTLTWARHKKTHAIYGGILSLPKQIVE